MKKKILAMKGYEKYVQHVPGAKSSDIFMYALSTCGWCAKTRELLDSLGVEYHYVDVDMVPGKPNEQLVKEMEQWNPSRSFPTMLINKGTPIIGFQEERIRKVLGHAKK